MQHTVNSSVNWRDLYCRSMDTIDSLRILLAEARNKSKEMTKNMEKMAKNMEKKQRPQNIIVTRSKKAKTEK